MPSLSVHSFYEDPAAMESAVREHRHREVIGGMWDEIGQLQLDFLRAQGLRPQHRLLDIGAGSLRLGAKAVRYLDAGNYFATDLNAGLLDAGWRRELDEDGRAKLPQANLLADGSFDFSFLPGPADFGMAQSVFTHLPFPFLRRCLIRAAPHFVPGGRLYVTAFLCPSERPLELATVHEPGGITTYDVQDPYHYRPADFRYAAAELPWRTRVVGEWGHPRAQQMIEYTRE